MQPRLLRFAPQPRDEQLSFNCDSRAKLTFNLDDENYGARDIPLRSLLPLLSLSLALVLAHGGRDRTAGRDLISRRTIRKFEVDQAGGK